MKGPQVERRKSLILKSDLTVNVIQKQERCIKLMLVFVQLDSQVGSLSQNGALFCLGSVAEVLAGDSPAGYVPCTSLRKAYMGRLGGI